MVSIHGPMMLGELIAALEATLHADMTEHSHVKSAGERTLYFDWCRLRPGRFHSYRGYYDHLAVGIDKHHEWTVGSFLAACKAQIGAVHEGWKGGGYTMNEKTPVWVADAGDCPGYGISGVKDEGYCVILITENFDH